MYDQDQSPVVVAVMGSTGAGKSTASKSDFDLTQAHASGAQFVHLLTRDDEIRIGHGLESETSTVQTAQYIDHKTGRTVVLIDTPGFDDSRQSIIDMDVLEMISRTLGAEGGPQQKLNGLIYMHPIADPRVGGTSRRNLRMFRSLCGDENLANVRIVTTNWCRVSEQEGTDQVEALRNEAFKPLLDAGAKMLRHDNNLGSAEKVMSELIPLPSITTQLERERHEGRRLSETSAGNVLGEEIARLQEKHAEELAALKKTMKEAGEAIDRAFTSELGQVRRHMEQVVQSGERERQKLGDTIQQLRTEVINLKEELDGRGSCTIM